MKKKRRICRVTPRNARVLTYGNFGKTQKIKGLLTGNFGKNRGRLRDTPDRVEVHIPKCTKTQIAFLFSLIYLKLYSYCVTIPEGVWSSQGGCYHPRGCVIIPGGLLSSQVVCYHPRGGVFSSQEVWVCDHPRGSVIIPGGVLSSAFYGNPNRTVP